MSLYHLNKFNVYPLNISHILGGIHLTHLLRVPIGSHCISFSLFITYNISFSTLFRQGIEHMARREAWS